MEDRQSVDANEPLTGTPGSIGISTHVGIAGGVVGALGRQLAKLFVKPMISERE
jgi:hypothetical protein